MKKLLKIDKDIYEIDDVNKYYKFYSRNSNWKKLTEDENIRNKKQIAGYRKIIGEKIVKRENKEEFYKELLSKPINNLIKNLSSNDATLKYQSSKALIELSEKNPKHVYPFFDQFVELFNNKNNIIKWTGIIVIGNLAPADSDRRIIKILPKLFSLLNKGKMITAGNTTITLSCYAKYFPELENKITNELLKVEKYKYDTKECSNIAIGHVINGFELYLDEPNKKVIDFCKRSLKNTRPATAKKAEKFLKRISPKISLTKELYE
jgi:hypothetical protein